MYTPLDRYSNMNTAIALPTISRKLPGNEALDSRLRVADAHTRDYKGMKKNLSTRLFCWRLYRKKSLSTWKLSIYRRWRWKTVFDNIFIARLIQKKAAGLAVWLNINNVFFFYILWVWPTGRQAGRSNKQSELAMREWIRGTTKCRWHTSNL